MPEELEEQVGRFKRMTALMNLALIGHEMRQSQKAFFKERRRSDLDKSKKLEAEFDLLLNNILSQDAQQKLFQS